MTFRIKFFVYFLKALFWLAETFYESLFLFVLWLNCLLPVGHFHRVWRTHRTLMKKKFRNDCSATTWLSYQQKLHVAKRQIDDVLLKQNDPKFNFIHCTSCHSAFPLNFWMETNSKVFPWKKCSFEIIFKLFFMIFKGHFSERFLLKLITHWTKEDS